MVILTKKEIRENVAEYYYQPEGEGECGLVSFDFVSYELTIIQLAEKDDEENCIYITNCCWEIRDFFKNNSFPQEKICKW